MNHMGAPSTGRPTHVCPKCGEWWDVECCGFEQWTVSAHDNEARLAVMVWSEYANQPICPDDTAALIQFSINLD